ncbi:cell division protein FtsL [Bacillus mesophilum]|uniref:Cell division protein FtsL n=1 Tax=Bacillus mesophilum TaxID=1071718 RepID=A0A7V7UWU2_9BACI|nr:cell division protein FtsL [Bacillus mesophilum]KAB2335316.1 cell division protein FtsL [Bacillus mesophilum]
MSNLARQIQQEQQQRQQQVQKTKKSVQRQTLFSPGEKILGILFAGAVCIGAVTMVSNQSAIYEVNKNIQQTEAAIQGQTEQNKDLTMQVAELSTYERIKAKAEELGLTFNEKNVKAVRD